MRRFPWLIMTAAICLLPPNAWPAQQVQQGKAVPPASSSPTTTATTPPPPALQTDSLADAARKAQEKKKDAPKTAKIFTNDNLPKQGGISSVGQPVADKSSDSGASTAAATTTSHTANDEKAWRDKFAALRKKLEQDQANADLMQREIGELSTQFYGGDPQKAFQDQQSQQPLGSEHAKKVTEIDVKKKQVEADQQAIDDAEDELRKSGGDPGWAR